MCWALLHNSATWVSVWQRTASYVFFGALFLPAFSWQAVGTLPHWPMPSVTSPMYGPWREWALQHLGCTCNGCINIHLFVNINCPCCSELLQIIHIDSALLMIKYNVLQCLHLTGKLDWIYRFEVGWVVFSYVAGLFFFFFPRGTLCHFANEELPSCLLIKTSISEGFASSCLIRQLIYCMPHRHL